VGERGQEIPGRIDQRRVGPSRPGVGGAKEKDLLEFLRPEQTAPPQGNHPQQYVREDTGFRSSVTRFFEVAEVLQLTPGQHRQLAAGKRLLEILDPHQQQHWRTVLGIPFAGPAAWHSTLGFQGAPEVLLFC